MIRLSPDEFGLIVEAALGEIPEAIQPHLENVIVEVQPRPSGTILRDSGISHGGSLLGLYIGRPLTQRSVETGAALPDRILLFQDNLQRICRSRAELRHEIRKTVLHEVGHHLGFDEDDLTAMGYG